MLNIMVMFIFTVLNRKHHFRKIWSRKSKLPVWAEIWYLYKSEYTESGGDVCFFCFGLDVSFLSKYNHSFCVIPEICFLANLVKKI